MVVQPTFVRLLSTCLVLALSGACNDAQQGTLGTVTSGDGPVVVDTQPVDVPPEFPPVPDSLCAGYEGEWLEPMQLGAWSHNFIRPQVAPLPGGGAMVVIAARFDGLFAATVLPGKGFELETISEEGHANGVGITWWPGAGIPVVAGYEYVGEGMQLYQRWAAGWRMSRMVDTDPVIAPHSVQFAAAESLALVAEHGPMNHMDITVLSGSPTEGWSTDALGCGREPFIALDPHTEEPWVTFLQRHSGCYGNVKQVLRTVPPGPSVDVYDVSLKTGKGGGVAFAGDGSPVVLGQATSGTFEIRRHLGDGAWAQTSLSAEELVHGHALAAAGDTAIVSFVDRSDWDLHVADIALPDLSPRTMTVLAEGEEDELSMTDVAVTRNGAVHLVWSSRTEANTTAVHYAYRCGGTPQR